MKKTIALAFFTAIAGVACAQQAADAKELFTLGQKEFKTYDTMFGLATVNPDNVDKMEMSKHLMDGYNYLLQALPLDSLPDAKGKVKPKYSNKIGDIIVGHINDFKTAGVTYYNNQKFYPEAYDAFSIYINMPTNSAFAKASALIPQDELALAYFNAGLSAYSGNQLEKGAEAFKNARLNHYNKPEGYLYEMACWQTLAQKDSTLEAEAQKNLKEIAYEGYKQFGAEEPHFLNNYINALIAENNSKESLAIVAEEIAKDPNNANLYGLEGFIYNRLGDEEKSEAAYRKAASLPTVNYETLLRAATRILHIGTEKLNSVEGNSADARQQRENLKNNYFLVVKDYLTKAKELNDKPDGMRDSMMERVEYALTTYFPL